VVTVVGRWGGSKAREKSTSHKCFIGLMPWKCLGTADGTGRSIDLYGSNTHMQGQKNIILYIFFNINLASNYLIVHKLGIQD